jgi:hypothetical protein
MVKVMVKPDDVVATEIPQVIEKKMVDDTGHWPISSFAKLI